MLPASSNVRHRGAKRKTYARSEFFSACQGWGRLDLFPWHRRLGSHVPYKNRTCRNHRPDVSAAFTTVAFDQSGPRWLGISDLIAEPEGPTFISYKVARRRLDRLRFVTQDPQRTYSDV